MSPTRWYTYAPGRRSIMAAIALAAVMFSVLGVAAPAQAATAPSVPTAVGVTAGESSLWVTWTAPADGGDPITKYDVSVFAGATLVGTYPAGGSTTGRSIGDLDNGTEYTATVTATNGTGTSAPSASATGTPFDARTPNTVTANTTVGKIPYGVAFSPDGTAAYITNYLDDTVSVIRTSDNTVTATITVGDGPYGVAVSPDGTTAYVTNYSPGTVSVIRTSDNTVTTTINAGNGPYGVAFSPDGTTAYITNNFDDTVSVIRTSDNTVTTTMTVGADPSGVAFSPDGTTAYITNNFDDTVSVIRTSDNTVTTTVTVGADPSGVAFSPDGTTAYITNINDDTVSVIRTSDNTATTTITVGDGPSRVAFSPDGTTAYITNYSAGTVSVIQFRGVPRAPTEVAATADESSLWVNWTPPADTGGDPITEYTVSVFDGATLVGTYPAGANTTGRSIGDLANGTEYTVTVTATNGIGTSTPSASATGTPVDARTPNTVTTTINVGDAPQGVAVSPDGTTAYVTNYSPGTVSVIRTSDNTVTATITVGAGPYGVAVSPDGTTAYVTNNFDDTVSVIRTSDNTVTATITVGDGPRDVAFSPDGTIAYVTNSSGGTVSVIDTATHTETATINFDGVPRAVAFSPDGNTAYVTTDQTIYGTVSVIDTATHTETATINVASYPESIAVSPDGTTAYVGTLGSERVTVIDTATNTVTLTMNVGSPGSVTFSPDGTTAYITDVYDDTVGVIDTTTGEVRVISVGDGPSGVAVSPDGTTAYVTNFTEGTVSVIQFRSVPDAPQNLVAVGAAGETVLTWDAPGFDGMTPITGYTVEYRETGAATWTSTSVGVVTTHTITGLTDDTGYEFRVSAVNAIGTSSTSAVATATTFAVPSAPTGVTATPGDGQVSLTWTAPASNGGTPITGYTVEYRETGAATWTSVDLGVVTTHAVTGLTDDTGYEFRVSAVNAIGTSATSAVATATTFSVPDAPMAVTAKPGNGQVSLTWTAPASNGGTPVTQYIVEYRETGTSTWVTFVPGGSGSGGAGAVTASLRLATITTTSATVTGLTNGTAYEFRVSAVNAIGTSTASAAAAATTFAVPGAPTGVTATPGDGQITLTWNAPASDGGTPVTGYTVEYRESGTSTWTSIDVGLVTTHTITGLTAGTEYEFRVSVTNAIGAGVSTEAGVISALAVTGFKPDALAWALLLLIAGAAAVVAGRRRAAFAQPQ